MDRSKMIFKNDYVILDANFTPRNADWVVLEVAALRLSCKGQQLGKYESLVQIDNLEARPPSTYLDHGIALVELQTAPYWGSVVSELIKFCGEADLTGWAGHDIMYTLQLAMQQSKKAENLYWKYKLDLRSYLCGKYNTMFSRELRKELNQQSLSSIGLERPLIRCQRVVQLMEVLSQEKTDDLDNKEEPYQLFEV
jgi:hypothetical protein